MTDCWNIRWKYWRLADRAT